MRAARSLFIVLFLLQFFPRMSALERGSTVTPWSTDSVTVCIPVHSGWNLISNPVRTSSDPISLAVSCRCMVPLPPGWTSCYGYCTTALAHG
jgi:hypothetical protein